MKDPKARGVQFELVKQEFARAKKFASFYDGGATVTHFLRTRVRRVSELLRDFERGSVLDIGCGPGIVGTVFNSRPIEYCGLDVSQEMINECIGRYGHDSRFKFVLGRAEELPFPSSRFDVVLCLGSLEYVLEFRKAITEIARVVKPKGIVIATMLNRESPSRIWEWHVYPKIAYTVGRIRRLGKARGNGQQVKGAPLILHKEKHFRSSLVSAGLQVEQVVYYDFNLLLAPLNTLFPRCTEFLSAKLEILSQSKVRFLGTGFIVRCRKNEAISFDTKQR